MVSRVEEQQILFCRAPDGTSIAYCATGTGPPLVRVAGWLTHLELEWTSPVWSHWLAALSSGRMLVRYDPRGCGLSGRSPEDLSLHAMVEDLEAVVDNLALEDLSLLGFGQGGVVAAAFAARHPQRVHRLVLYCSYAQGALARRADPLKKREAEAVAQIIEVSWGRRAASLRQILANLLMPGGSAEQQQALNTLQRSSASRQTAARLWRTLQSVDISDLARGVRAPTLVLHVSDDALVPSDASLQLASLIPHVRHVAVAGKNHIVLEDEPAWAHLLAETQDFLSDETGPAASGLQEAFAHLTRREREVLELTAQGFSNGEIAERLVITPKTVRNHLTRIYSEMQVNSRARAIVAAREAGFGRAPS